MNKLVGHISGLETEGEIAMVTIDTGNDLFLKAIVIDTPETAPYLVLNQEVNVLFKETEVVIGLEGVTGISLRNKLPCLVKRVEKGRLLSGLELECPGGRIHSIISTQSLKELDLLPGKSVMAMIKLNEVMLSPR